MSLRELAETLGISREYCYKLAHQDGLPVPVLRVGARWVVPRDAVEDFLSGKDGG